jgi:hypothetical protein
MKTITSREFYHQPALVNSLHPGQQLVVTDKGQSFAQRTARNWTSRSSCNPSADMTIYADTSFLVASRYRRDTFHRQALDFFGEHEEDAWLWSPWHRVEVLHALRQYAQHPEPKRAIPVADAKALIHRIETDVRLGYLLHMEADWRDVLRTANELSAEHGFKLVFRGGDLLHVAYALELAAGLFVTFDERQAAIAEAAGLEAAKPE